MANIKNYRIEWENNQPVLVINLAATEFSSEFSTEFGLHHDFSKHLTEEIKRIAKEQSKHLKITKIKIMAGPILISSLLWEHSAEAVTNFNMGYQYFGSSSAFIQYIDLTHGSINVTSPSYFDINPDGTLKLTSKFDPNFIKEMHKRGVKVVPFLSNHWDRELGRTALANREKLAEQIATTIMQYNLDGVNVDIENVTDLDRENFTDFVRILRNKLPADKEVSVAVAANPNGWTKGWHGSYDYEKLSYYADYLMIMAYDESYPNSAPGPVASLSFVERSIQYALAQKVPPHKVVLGIPHYGRYWVQGQPTGGQAFSNTRIEELRKLYKHSIEFDPVSQSPKMTLTINSGDPIYKVNGVPLSPGTYTIWYENEQSIKAKTDLIDRYKLKGSGHWSIGQENAQIWSSFRAWINESTTSVDNIIQFAGISTTNSSLYSSPTTSSYVYRKLPTSTHFRINSSAILNGGIEWYPVTLIDGTVGYIQAKGLKLLQINELQGINRYDTSANVTKQGWTTPTDVVVLGRGDIPVDALTGGVLAKKHNAPLLLTESNSLPSSIEREITRLKPSTIYLLGGEGAISPSIQSYLQSKGYTVKRIAGINRYATSVEIAKNVGINQEIILTTGKNSPDALSIAPYAGMKGIPILFTDVNKLPSEVRDLIQKNKINKVTIIGGEGVVSKEIVNELKSLGIIHIERVAGKDRYETSLAITKKYHTELDLSNLYFASGVSYIDALSGSPLAAAQHAPILLVNKNELPAVIKTWMTNELTTTSNLHFLGGTGVITKHTRDSVFTIIK